MTTSKQDKDFLSSVIDENLLEKAIEWIQDNLEVYEVFDEDKIVKYVGNGKNPDEVFDNSTLEDWARDNGFSKVD